MKVCRSANNQWEMNNDNNNVTKPKEEEKNYHRVALSWVVWFNRLIFKANRAIIMPSSSISSSRLAHWSDSRGPLPRAYLNETYWTKKKKNNEFSKIKMKTAFDSLCHDLPDHCQMCPCVRVCVCVCVGVYWAISPRIAQVDRFIGNERSSLINFPFWGPGHYQQIPLASADFILFCFF